MEIKYHKEACNIILNNSYMDDIIGNVNQHYKARQTMEEIDNVLDKGGWL